MLCTAGSPLPAEGYRYVYEQLGPDVLLNNGSGGTDVCTGHRPGGFAAARVRGRDLRAVPRRRRRTRSTARATRVVGELGELVITQPMPSMPVGLWNDPDGSRYRGSYFDTLPGRLAPGRLDQVHRARQLRHHRPLRRDAQPRRRAPRHGRVLRGGRGAPGDRSTASSSTSRTTRAARASCSCSSCSADGAVLDDALRDRDRRGAALRAVAAPRARHDLVGAGDPAHADRQEARGAGQADPPRRVRPSASPAGTRCSTRPRSTRSWPWLPSARPSKSALAPALGLARGPDNCAS